MKRCTLALAGSLVGLALPAAGQINQFGNEPDRTLPWYDTPTSSPGRMVAGDVVRDLRPDAVILQGTTPVVVSAASVYNTIFPITSASANDLTLIPHGGGGDDILIVNSTGLQRLAHTTSGNFTATTIESSAWAGATRVVAGDGGSFAVGVSSSGNVLLYDFESSMSMSFAPVATILDLVPIRWGTTEHAVAVLHTSGFTVYAPDEVPLTTSTTIDTLTNISLAVQAGVLGVVHEGSTVERCLLVFTSSNQEYMGVADDGGYETPTAISNNGHFAVALADVDGDDYDDLLLTRHATHRSFLFINQTPNPSATKTFTSTQAEAIDLVLNQDPPPSTWSAWPVLADFSNDGDADIAAYVEATNQFVYLENSEIPLSDDSVAIDKLTYFFDYNNVPSGYLRWDVQPSPNATFTPTHVQLRVMRSLNAVYLGEVLPGEEGYESPEFLPSSLVTTFFYPFVSGAASTDQFVSEMTLSSAYVYYCELRAVRLESGVVVQAGPSEQHMISVSSLVSDGLVDPDRFEVEVIELNDDESTLLDLIELSGRNSSPSDSTPLPDPPPPNEAPPNPDT